MTTRPVRITICQDSETLTRIFISDDENTNFVIDTAAKMTLDRQCMLGKRRELPKVTIECLSEQRYEVKFCGGIQQHRYRYYEDKNSALNAVNKWWERRFRVKL